MKLLELKMRLWASALATVAVFALVEGFPMDLTDAEAEVIVLPNTPENSKFKWTSLRISIKVFVIKVERLSHLSESDLAEELSGQYQGDIIISAEQLREYESGRSSKTGLRDEKYRWLNGVVPYRVNESDFSEFFYCKTKRGAFLTFSFNHNPQMKTKSNTFMSEPRRWKKLRAWSSCRTIQASTKTLSLSWAAEAVATVRWDAGEGSSSWISSRTFESLDASDCTPSCTSSSMQSDFITCNQRQSVMTSFELNLTCFKLAPRTISTNTASRRSPTSMSNTITDRSCTTRKQLSPSTARTQSSRFATWTVKRWVNGWEWAERISSVSTACTAVSRSKRQPRLTLRDVHRLSSLKFHNSPKQSTLGWRTCSEISSATSDSEMLNKISQLQFSARTFPTFLSPKTSQKSQFD